MRFALNNPQIHIAGLHRALKGVSHYLALKTLTQFMDRRNHLAGVGADGVQFALMGNTGVFAQLRAQYRRGNFRRTANDSGAAV